MRSLITLFVAALACIGGMMLFPMLQSASAGNFKQLAIAIHNYHDYSEPDSDRLSLKSSDAVPGLMMTEKGEVVEAVAFQRRDNDFIFIQLGTGESIPAAVLWSDADDLLLMDADGLVALFIIL